MGYFGRGSSGGIEELYVCMCINMETEKLDFTGFFAQTNMQTETIPFFLNFYFHQSYNLDAIEPSSSSRRVNCN